MASINNVIADMKTEIGKIYHDCESDAVNVLIELKTMLSKQPKVGYHGKRSIKYPLADKYGSHAINVFIIIDRMIKEQNVEGWSVSYEEKETVSSFNQRDNETYEQVIGSGLLTFNFVV